MHSNWGQSIYEPAAEIDFAHASGPGTLTVGVPEEEVEVER